MCFPHVFSLWLLVPGLSSQFLLLMSAVAGCIFDFVCFKNPVYRACNAAVDDAIHPALGMELSGPQDYRQSTGHSSLEVEPEHCDTMPWGLRVLRWVFADTLNQPANTQPSTTVSKCTQGGQLSSGSSISVLKPETRPSEVKAKVQCYCIEGGGAPAPWALPLDTPQLTIRILKWHCQYTV